MILSLCTFIHVRRRIGYQLVINHVLDFLCAVKNAAPLAKSSDLEKLSCRAKLWKSAPVLQALAQHSLLLIHSALVIDGNAL